MNGRIKAITVGIFGTCVIASGLWRFFLFEGGHTGLTFGAAMGVIAVLSATLLVNSHRIPGLILAWISIAFVGGWFFYEALIKKGLAVAEPRQLIVLVLSLLTAVILCLPHRRTNR